MDSSNDTYREDRTSSKYSKAPMSPSSPNDNLQHYDDDDQDSSQESYFFGGHRRTHSGRRHSFTEGATSSQYSLGLEDLLNRQQSAAEVLEAFNAGSGNRMAEEDGYTAADYAAYAAASAASTRRYGNLSDGYGDFNPAAFNNHMHRSMLASGGMDPASQHAFLAAMSGAAFPGYPMPASSPFMASPTGMASAARLDGNRRNRRIPRAQSMTNLAAAAAAGGSPFFGMTSPAFPNFRPHHPHLPNSPISPNMPGAHPYMFSEQQMFEAMSHSHAFSPLSSYYLNAAAAAAQASNAAQFRAAAAAASANPPASKASSSKPNTASVSATSSRPDDPRFSDSDVKLLKAAERIAKAQSSSLNNVQSEAEAASIRDRHRQALAEAALYTQSQQAAAAITAAAYATLSPSSSTPGRRSSSQGRGKRLVVGFLQVCLRVEFSVDPCHLLLPEWKAHPRLLGMEVLELALLA
ncbi:hypothetical protein BC829DRAFT_58348 [Chytridium lagenaria]|nr:hypothetical protein BC829DRAFT_58348 [Chytridium lagenaria]